MKFLIDRLPAGMRVGTPVLVSAAAVGISAVVVAYGVGDILGAGIYGLVGKAAGQAGYAVWLTFLASMVAAGLTGLSYASLGSRYPRAAGASYITFRAFGNRFLSWC
ncbi:MAG: hypothetical protein RL354_2139, partial [Planctomycetota bacterium]